MTEPSLGFRVTADGLRKKDVPRSIVEKFERECPDGAVLSAEVLRRAGELGLSADWFAGHLLSARECLTYEQPMGAAERAFKETTDSAWQAYKEATAAALREYEEAKARVLWRIIEKREATPQRAKHD